MSVQNDSTRREFIQGSLAVTGTLIASTLGASARAEAPTAKRPNLVFFFGEGQRADALSIAGIPF